MKETDKTWADEGPEFCSFEIPEWKARVGVGICMDINPWEYKEFELYEFANYHLKEKSQIIILLANWLKSESNETSMSTQNYWAIRLAPLFKKKVSFVACNRVGTEKGD